MDGLAAALTWCLTLSTLPTEVLVQRLGDEEWQVREQATAQLEALGPAAVPRLRQAARHHPDAEVRRRATQVLGRHARQVLAGPLPSVYQLPPAFHEVARAYHRRALGKAGQSGAEAEREALRLLLADVLGKESGVVLASFVERVADNPRTEPPTGPDQRPFHAYPREQEERLRSYARQEE